MLIYLKINPPSPSTMWGGGILSINVHFYMTEVIFWFYVSTVNSKVVGFQYIGWFKEGSQAYRKCRECMAIAEEIQSHVCKLLLNI